MSGSLLQSAQTKQLLTILFSSTAQPFQASAAALQEAFAPASRFPALCSALLLFQARWCTGSQASALVPQVQLQFTVYMAFLRLGLSPSTQ